MGSVKNGFSLAEIMSIMLVLSIILAASMPIITKRSLSAANSATVKDKVPIGGIVMWSPTYGTPPPTYAICNGSNGTPNLTDRFVVGVGGTASTGIYSLGARAGEATHVLTAAEIPSHNHDIIINNISNHIHSGTSVSCGNHRHSGDTSTESYYHRHRQSGYNAGNEYGGASGSITTSHLSGSQTHYTYPLTSGIMNDHTHGSDMATSDDGSHTHGDFTTGTSANHYHTLTLTNTGIGTAHENRPLYYALYYIMRKS